MKVLETLKFSKWWHPKIGTGVFTWLLFSVYLTNKVETDLKALLLFGLLILLGVLGHLINDASDYKQDKKVGKNNLFNKFGIQRAPWIILTFIIAATFLSFQFNRLICYLTILQIFFNGFYSFRPIRLKEKGWWAVIITGFYERTIPYTIILFWLIIPQDLTVVQIIFLFFYFSWAYLWECRNYINGQSNDIESDKLANVYSLGITVEVEKTQRVKNNFSHIEIGSLTLWLFYLFIENHLFMTVFVLSFILLHSINLIVNKELDYTLKFERFIDFSYTNLFVLSIIATSVLSEKISVSIGIVLFILFQTSYAYATLNWIKSKLIYIYYFIFGIGSFVVNHTIYYLRKLFNKNTK